MTPHLNRKFRLYVSLRHGRIEVAEVNSVDESALRASTKDAFVACGTADSKEQAWAIRDRVCNTRDPGQYSVHVPNPPMTSEQRKNLAERIETVYQEMTKATGDIV